jgi:DNA-binding NarL/FixJ family response regulator
VTTEPPPQLTERQQQVADLKNRGYGVRRIARILGISTSAVRDHLDAIERRTRKGDAA